MVGAHQHRSPRSHQRVHERSGEQDEGNGEEPPQHRQRHACDRHREHDREQHDQSEPVPPRKWIRSTARASFEDRVRRHRGPTRLSMNACTIVSRRQLPFARVLARSFEEHHPGASFTTVVVDRGIGHDRLISDLDVVRPEDLPVDTGQFLDMAFVYHEAELIRALKPYALRYLVETLGTPAVYLAPDVAVYASLEEALRPSRPDAVVLVPHTTVPFPDDDRAPGVYDVLGRGAFDGGLVAVGPEATGFLDYWSSHLHLDCVFEPQNLEIGRAHV